RQFLRMCYVYDFSLNDLLAPSVTHSEADIQLIFKLLQDLQSSMNKTQQHQEEAQALVCVYEAQQKELKNHGVEEGQLKRSLGMKMDKESKQHIRRQKKKEIKDQYIEDVLGQCDNVHQKREQIADQIQERDRFSTPPQSDDQPEGHLQSGD
uniref:kinetochore protein Nuf2-like n=1 Tax=Oncorhynchus gorbuscha TaxID=8017 RepID=UPI001EAED58D